MISLRKKIAGAIIFFVLCSWGTVLAAAGARPDLKAPALPPLQPPPVDMAPNYQSNVNSISNPDVVPPGNGPDTKPGQNNPPAQPAGGGSSRGNSAGAGGVGSFASRNKALIIVWVLAAFLVGAGIYWRWGKKKNGQE